MTDTQDSNLLLAERLKQRAEYGKAKYGVALKPWDGRNTVMDALEEALDLAVYLMKLDQERKELRAWCMDICIELDSTPHHIRSAEALEWCERLTADIPRIGSKSEAELERETWAAVKGPGERLADMSATS